MHIGRNCTISSLAIIEEPSNVFIGDNVQIKPGVVLRPETGFIYIGNNVVINHYTVIHAKGGVEIGDWSIIAPHCGIYAQNHSWESFDKPITLQPNVGNGITLMGDNWLGAGSIILDGVTLGKGTVVGAGSVVNRSVPMAKIVAGNPARIVKSRSSLDEWDFKSVERCSVEKTPECYWTGINSRRAFALEEVSEGDTVLDIGCGEGNITEALTGKCKKVIGIDYSPDALETAKKRCPILDVHHIAATNIDFPAASFDTIVFFEVLEHLTPLQGRTVIGKILNLLKPHGKLVGSTPLRLTETSSPSTYSHIFEYSEAELRDLLHAFSDLRIKDQNLFTARKG